MLVEGQVRRQAECRRGTTACISVDGDHPQVPRGGDNVEAYVQSAVEVDRRGLPRECGLHQELLNPAGCLRRRMHAASPARADRRLTVAIRRPPSPITNPQVTGLGPGTELHRVHRTTFRPAEFNPGVGGQTHFAPFSDSAGAPVPSLYASAALASAIHETIFHDVPASATIKTVRLNEVHVRTHSVLRTNRDLRLVGFRNVTLGKWGISRSDLITSGTAMRLAETIRA